MNKILAFVICILVSSSSFADDIQDTFSPKVLLEYFNTLIPKEKEKVYSNFKRTPLMRKALENYANGAHAIEIEAYTKKDPHDTVPNNPDGLMKKIPNWEKVFDDFYESATKEKNPIAAAIALYISKSYLGKINNPKNYKERKELSYALSMYDICEGHIQYGIVLRDGVAHKVDLKGALESFRKAEISCASLGGWQEQVARMHANNLSRQMDQAKD